MMKPLTLAIACVLLSSVTPAAEPAFDPKQCSRIGNVDLPYDVAIAGDELRFTGRATISVTPDRIRVGAAEFTNRKLATALHGDLKAFLTGAKDVANASSSFAMLFGVGAAPRNTPDTGRPRPGFVASITAMCRAILAVEASERAVKAAFPAFVPPVEVTLARE
jgi:hypothetical protein